MKYKKIGIISGGNSDVIFQKNLLSKKYNLITQENSAFKKDEIDLIIILGGDGLMLHSLHQYQDWQVPLYGINYGTIGFLMNGAHQNNLLSIIEKAEETILHPLKMTAIDYDGKEHNYWAINDVSLLRQTYQAAKIRIEINDQIRIDNLICDGVVVSTPAGSTAYNLSLYGPIIPFGAQIISLMPISPFRPRNWRGALLPQLSKIKFIILENQTRCVSATADYNEVRNVTEVTIGEDRNRKFKILFDPNHSLEERIIREQFL